MNKKIKIAVTIVICVLLIAVLGYWLIGNPFVRMNNQKLEKAVKSIDSEVVWLNEVIPFEWDTLYTFEPYQSKQEIEEIIGFRSFDVKENNVNEGMVHLLFVKGHKVIASVLGYRNNLGYSINFASIGKMRIDYHENAQFRVSKSEGVTSLTLIQNVPDATEESGQADYPAMIMVQGKLYYDSDEISTEARCGNMDGEITSDTNTEPTEDNQSNFGTGYEYQFWADDEIHVYIDDEWHIFIPYGVKRDDWDNLTEQQKMEQDPTYHGDEAPYKITDGTYAMDSKFESQIYPPTVTFSTEDMTFSFGFDALSSYMNVGTYVIENDEIVATTSDAKYTFVFQIIDETTVSFVADKSASTKMVEGKTAVPDGEVFTYNSDIFDNEN